MEVIIKVSKTDPFHQGVTVYLGPADTDLCLVAAVLSYMTKHRMDRGPSFRYDRDQALTREICEQRTISIASSGNRSEEILWSQLSNRGSNDGCLLRSPRLAHQDAWPMGKHGLYTLYTNTQGDTMYRRTAVGCRTVGGDIRIITGGYGAGSSLTTRQTLN